tara:strand:+ start:2356 stop:3918 length:1563 start_codon:yes stop_codon:yes gene_type:complete
MNELLKSSLELAVFAHGEGKLSEAVIRYQSILGSVEGRQLSRTESALLAVAQNNLGFIMQCRKNTSAAAECYQAAVELNPSYSEAHHNLGHILHEVGDLKGATQSYEKVVQIAPKCIDSLNTLGSALLSYGDLPRANTIFRQALQLDPHSPRALNNLGSVLLALGEVEEAITYFKAAISLNPNYENALINLGDAFRDLKKLSKAYKCYSEALVLEPDSIRAHNSLGNLLRYDKRYEKALESFNVINSSMADSKRSRSPKNDEYWFNAEAQALECLFLLDRYEELIDKLKALAHEKPDDRRISALSCFATDQLGISNPYNFCPKPLEFIHISSLAAHISELPSFIKTLIDDGLQEPMVWEPRHGVTDLGFLSANSIFFASDSYRKLEQILWKEIEIYYKKFRNQECKFIELWPHNYQLKGWLNKLRINGYQRSHIHPAGWLSGIIYLNVKQFACKDAGAIEFGLRGYDFPESTKVNRNKVYHPKIGDIILFPSSTFHATKPFNEEYDRISLAFDLIPCVKS